MKTENYVYHDANQALHGFLAYDKKNDQPKPAVLVVHDWSGRNNFACEKAKMLASMGYVGFAVDMYGHGQVGETVDEKMALMEPLMKDRALLRHRMRAGLDAVMALSCVDAHRVAAIGFCFGGLCVLDLARSGAPIQGGVSFHGLLNKPENLPNQAIHAKLLALHGYDDPMVKPDQVDAFCQEMTEAKADWQVHMYGHTQHAFSNPLAHDAQLGTLYNAKAERRSLQAMANFLEEVFA